MTFGAFIALLIAVSQVIAAPNATGYEVSMYAVFPWHFWLAIILTIVLGALVIFNDGLHPRRGIGDWRFGFLAMYLAEAVLLFLPSIRGYAIYGRADALTHIGFMRSIEQTGVFGARNIYPALHDLGLTLSYLSGLSLDGIVTILPPVFTLFSILAGYVLINECFERQQKLFILPFSSLLIFSTGHLNFAPYAQSLLLIPFVIFLFFKYRDKESPAVFIVFSLVIVSIVFYHPLTTVFLVSAFAVAYPIERSYYRHAVSLNVAAVAMIVFGMWYFGFIGILRMISTTVYNLALSSGESDIEQYSDVIARTSPSIADLFQVAIFKYGMFLIASIFVGLFIVKLLWNYLTTRQKPEFVSLFFTGIYMLFGAISTLFLFNDVVGGFGRPMAFAKLFAVLISGIFASLVVAPMKRPSRQGVVNMVIALGFVSMVIISTFGLFASPLMKEQSWQTTEMELDGMDWVITFIGEDKPVMDLGINPQRYFERVVGVRGFRSMNTQGPPVDHFGYQNSSRLGTNYPTDYRGYLVISEHGRVTYPQVFPDYSDLWRFTPDDFQRLERDPTVNHLYDNHEFDTYVVRGTNETTVVP